MGRGGGVNVIDFDIINGVLKLKWLKSFIGNDHSFWFIIPSAIFKKLGGIHFFLRCDFECTSLPVKPSNFHQQVILYWKLLFKHNFTPHNTPVWNNRYIKLGRKSVYFEEWKSKGIWAIAHFLDDNGNLLLHSEFWEKFQLQCTVNIYYRMTEAIPVALRLMVKEDIVHSQVSQELRQLFLEGFDFCERKNAPIRLLEILSYSLIIQTQLKGNTCLKILTRLK
ncbi:Trimeric intracellular cation channel type A [Labeo rohita]|uniref:Trimeric intracellular cation channel type A n=1 Tax=Labeo rohita TaxID=84645 RepID=A0ABQ8L984_LABRO|nr:Trimeric intracellular cation channel type A [Labeo rohita]